jgi:hypothetical protein
MPFILPGDYWILLISILFIILFAAKKLLFSSFIGLGATTAIIFQNYGTGRAALHLLVMFTGVFLLRVFIRKFATQEVSDDE